MLHFSLRQLELFALISRLGSVTRAGEAMGLSQSAASAALAELERRSATRLFDRMGKRLKLNDAGRRLLPRAIDLIDRAAEIDGMLAGAMLPGKLRVGTTLTIGNYLMPGLIEILRRRWSTTTLAVATCNTSQVLARVALLDLDLGLIEGPCDDPDLEVIDWLRDEFVVFCSPAHRLARAGRVTVDMLMEEEWVVRESGSGTRQALDAALRPWRDRWRIAVEIDQIEAMLRFVAIGKSIGCASRLALRDDLTIGRLVEIPVAGLKICRNFSIVLRRDKYRSSAMEAVLAVCREAASQSLLSHEVEIGKMQAPGFERVM